MEERILNKIDEIEKALSNEIKRYPVTSMLSGVSGFCIFYLLLYKLTNDSRYKHKISEIIETVFDRLNDDHSTNISYCNGLTGVAYALEFLASNDMLSRDDIADVLEDIDEGLTDYTLKNLYDVRDIDFFHGGLGTAHYLYTRLEHSPEARNRSQQVLESIIPFINKDISRTKEVAHLREFHEGAHLARCGMAHGHGAYLVILSNYLTVFPENPDIRRTLESSLACLLEFKSNNPETLSFFPGKAVNRFMASYTQPLSWCFGDQSVAYAMHKAGKSLGLSSIQADALEIASKALTRTTVEEALMSEIICDAAFCHGICGVAYLHKKWYQITGKQEFLDLSQTFIKHTLDFAKEGSGVAGYQSYVVDGPNLDDLTLLTGAAGIGVVLIDHLLGEENDVPWESIFLLN